MPVSRTSKRRRSADSCRRLVDARRTTTSPCVGELDRVADQVHEHLAQPPRIAPHDRRHVGSDQRGQLEALGLRRARPAARATSSTASRRSKSMVSSSSLPASIFEKSRMSLMIASSASPDCAHRLRRTRAARGVSSRVEQQLGHADHAVHRRADLVAHLGQELALGPARRLRRVARLPQLLLGALALGDVAVRRHEAAPRIGLSWISRMRSIGTAISIRLGWNSRALATRSGPAPPGRPGRTRRGPRRCGGTPRGAAPPTPCRARAA